MASPDATPFSASLSINPSQVQKGTVYQRADERQRRYPPVLVQLHRASSRSWKPGFPPALVRSVLERQLQRAGYRNRRQPQPDGQQQRQPRRYLLEQREWKRERQREQLEQSVLEPLSGLGGFLSIVLVFGIIGFVTWILLVVGIWVIAVVLLRRLPKRTPGAASGSTMACAACGATLPAGAPSSARSAERARPQRRPNCASRTRLRSRRLEQPVRARPDSFLRTGRTRVRGRSGLHLDRAGRHSDLAPQRLKANLESDRPVSSPSFPPLPTPHTRVGVGGVLLRERTSPRQSSGLSGPGSTIPSGFVDPGETLETAVIREFEEESGVTPRVGSLLPSGTRSSGRSRAMLLRLPPRARGRRARRCARRRSPSRARSPSRKRSRPAGSEPIPPRHSTGRAQGPRLGRDQRGRGEVPVC